MKDIEPTRRMARLPISIELLSSVLRIGVPEGFAISGLPADYKIVSIDGMRINENGQVTILMESEEFATVKAGDYLPIIDTVVNKVEQPQ